MENLILPADNLAMASGIMLRAVVIIRSIFHVYLNRLKKKSVSRAVEQWSMTCNDAIDGCKGSLRQMMYQTRQQDNHTKERKDIIDMAELYHAFWSWREVSPTAARALMGTLSGCTGSVATRVGMQQSYTSLSSASPRPIYPSFFLYKNYFIKTKLMGLLL